MRQRKRESGVLGEEKGARITVFRQKWLFSTRFSEYLMNQDELEGPTWSGLFSKTFKKFEKFVLPVSGTKFVPGSPSGTNLYQKPNGLLVQIKMKSWY